MAETVVPGLEQRLKAHLLGEVNFDAFTRGRYATDASHYQIMPVGVVAPRSIEGGRARARACARGRRERAAARRRHLAVRPDRECLAGHRLLAPSRPCAGARRARPALHGRAWHRARRAQSPAASARAVVSGRHLHRLARHHRRHGRQQFLRRALAALRQHPRERARDRRGAGGRRACAFRSGRARPLRPAAAVAARSARARAARHRRARGRRDRSELSEGAAPGRRLQSRRAGARPQRSQSRAHPGRLRGHARILHQDRAQACAAARPARRRRLPFRQLRDGDGCRAAHRQARADRGRAGRPHHAGPRARHRDVQAHHRRGRARRS